MEKNQSVNEVRFIFHGDEVSVHLDEAGRPRHIHSYASSPIPAKLLAEGVDTMWFPHKNILFQVVHWADTGVVYEYLKKNYKVKS
jgi:hypothetical protein